MAIGADAPLHEWLLPQCRKFACWLWSTWACFHVLLYVWFKYHFI